MNTKLFKVVHHSMSTKRTSKHIQKQQYSWHTSLHSLKASIQTEQQETERLKCSGAHLCRWFQSVGATVYAGDIFFTFSSQHQYSLPSFLSVFMVPAFMESMRISQTVLGHRLSFQSKWFKDVFLKANSFDTFYQCLCYLALYNTKL